MITKIFALGDIVGRPGRNMLRDNLVNIRKKYEPDLMLLNGENAAGGFGLTEKIYREFCNDYGIDCITMGNHWHDKKEILNYKADATRLVLPANMENVEDEEEGLKILETKGGTRFAVMNLIGSAFMKGNNRNPFHTVSRLIAKIPEAVKIRIVDIHAEASSEKQGMAHFLHSKVSLVYGTHSHVPTSDERIINNTTGFITDIGATGSYDSIIGMSTEIALKRMLTGKKMHLKPAKKDPWLCAVYVEVENETGHCTKIERIQIRGQTPD